MTRPVGTPLACEWRAPPTSKRARYDCATLTVTYDVGRAGTLSRAEMERIANAYLASAAPIPMILHCPACHLQHVDAPDEAKGWTNPPHRSHLCHGCGYIWRPADVATTGVKQITTHGEHDTSNHHARRFTPEEIAEVRRRCSHDVDADDLEDDAEAARRGGDR